MLDLDISLFIVFAFVWILLLVLKKIYFNPVQRMRAERDSLIQDNTTAAARAQEEVERTLAEIEDRIRQTRTDAAAARSALEKDAQKKKDELIAEVSQESKKQVEAGKAELDTKMTTLLSEMEAQSESLAKRIEKKLLH